MIARVENLVQHTALTDARTFAADVNAFVFAPPASERFLRLCHRCGGSGEEHRNRSKNFDPQCDESETCTLCHGEGFR